MKNFSSLSFMIVDDVRTTRISILGMLKEFGNPVLFHAENGHEAISMMQDTAKDVDCIISDFNMPVMHGLKMVKMIRTGHGNIRRDIPVIMLTGHGDRRLLGVSLALDVNAFLVKPASKNVLFERIIKMLNTLESETHWVKPVESYLCIDSDSSIQELLEKPSIEIEPDLDRISKSIKDHNNELRDKPSTNLEPDRERMSMAIEDHRKKQRMKDAILLSEPRNSSTSSSSSSTSHLQESSPLSPEEGEEIKGIRCHLDQIPVNSILARDVHGYKKKKLLSKNMKLSQGLIDRLKDMKELGEPVGELWIIATEQ